MRREVFEVPDVASGKVNYLFPSADLEVEELLSASPAVVAQVLIANAHLLLLFVLWKCC